MAPSSESRSLDARRAGGSEHGGRRAGDGVYSGGRRLRDLGWGRPRPGVCHHSPVSPEQLTRRGGRAKGTGQEQSHLRDPPHPADALPASLV